MATRIAKKLTAAEEERVKGLKTSIAFHGKGTREAVRDQNQINEIFGVGPKRDWTNLPTSNQMKIAKSGKDTAVAGMRATKATKAAEGLSSGDLVTKALAGLKAPKEDKKPKKGNKTRSDLNKMLGGM